MNTKPSLRFEDPFDFLILMIFAGVAAWAVNSWIFFFCAEGWLAFILFRQRQNFVRFEDDHIAIRKGVYIRHSYNVPYSSLYDVLIKAPNPWHRFSRTSFHFRFADNGKVLKLAFKIDGMGDCELLRLLDSKNVVYTSEIYCEEHPDNSGSSY